MRPFGSATQAAACPVDGVNWRLSSYCAGRFHPNPGHQSSDETSSVLLSPSSQRPVFTFNPAEACPDLRPALPISTCGLLLYISTNRLIDLPCTEAISHQSPRKNGFFCLL